jgi:hypothetical protein
VISDEREKGCDKKFSAKRCRITSRDVFFHDEAKVCADDSAQSGVGLRPESFFLTMRRKLRG